MTPVEITLIIVAILSAWLGLNLIYLVYMKWRNVRSESMVTVIFMLPIIIIVLLARRQ